MNKNEIIGILNAEGEVGSTETERYVEIYEDLKLNELNLDEFKELELAQMIWLGEERVLQAYFLDKDNEGHFYDWKDLPTAIKIKICNLEIWHIV